MRSYHPVALKIPAKYREAPDTRAVVRRLHDAQGGLCFYCERFVGLSAATVDHWIPRGKGGSDEIGNKVMACDECNCHKANMMPAEYFKLIGKPLVPPVRDGG